MARREELAGAEDMSWPDEIVQRSRAHAGGQREWG